MPDKNPAQRRRHTKTMVQHSARPAAPTAAIHRRKDRTTRRWYSPKNLPQRNHRTRNQPRTLDKHPDEVREVYKIWRPTPLIRALNLEKALKTPAKIYYKYEGVSPAGSHKPNTAVPQAYYNMKEGTKRLSTETGAGQWGSALAFAAGVFGLQSTIYMVRASYDQKPYRKMLMNAFGGECIASPSDRTEAGRKILAEDPDNKGSLGIAISEAIEDALVNEAETN